MPVYERNVKCTNLQVTGESLRYSIESSMADGTGCVAHVRLAEEQDTGRKKGYAFVDFIDVPSAERACKELQGIVQLIYFIFLIFEI